MGMTAATTKRHFSVGLIEPQTDPLLAALIAKLPAVGDEFTREQRAAWLKMMAMAFDVAYGPTESPLELPTVEAMRGAVAPIPAAAAPAGAQRAAHAGHDFYISMDGTVCNASGEPVLVSDIPPDEIVFDYRPVGGDFRDLDSITWADGSHGRAGIAAGISFCGPG